MITSCCRGYKSTLGEQHVVSEDVYEGLVMMTSCRGSGDDDVMLVVWWW